jgi:hypothetical protein
VRYRSLRVGSLGKWAPQLHTGLLVSGATQAPILRQHACLLPGCHGLWRRFPDVFGYASVHQCATAVAHDWASNPLRATPAGLAHARFRLLPVRSPLLREYFLFLGVHEMFQFPRCPPHHMMRSSSSRRWGCPIRRSWDQRLLAAPPRLSQLCHVLHRHAAPRHPPSAHTVFPEGRRGVDRLDRLFGVVVRHDHAPSNTLCTW